MPGPLGTETHSPVIDPGTLALRASPLPGPTCATRQAADRQSNTDISASDGAKIVAEAATWMGTPYSLVGQGSAKGEGGDCSGSTFKIYQAAGFPYDYQQSAAFQGFAARTGRFREINPALEAMQAGDILSWPNHMAIYAVFGKDDPNARTDRVNRGGNHWSQVNNMWTATHPNGPAYQAAELRYFRPDPPKVYRYQRIAGGVCPP